MFDGADLPNKQITDDSRKLLLFPSLLISRRRDEALSRAQELEQSGNVTEARSEYYKALEITPELYVPLIKRLTLMGIQYIVAPYEADAELGYLYRNNFVDFVITEDGDSLVYGCRCVLFKLDNGVGDEIDVSRWTSAAGPTICSPTCASSPAATTSRASTASESKPPTRLSTWRSDLTRSSTCFARRPPSPTGTFFSLLLSSYVAGFMRAVFTFRHQTVIDPRSLATVPLMPYTPAVAAMDKRFLGPALPCELAAKVAMGQLHPTTHLPLVAEPVEMEEERSQTQEVAPVRFSSPFISVSFRALIEKPSQRGLATTSDLSLLDGRIKRMATPVKGVDDGSVGPSVDSMGSVISMEPSLGSTTTFPSSLTTPSTMAAPTREYRSVVAESPPRKRVAGNRVEESPVINRNSFLDRFRNTIVGNSPVCIENIKKE